MRLIIVILSVVSCLMPWRMALGDGFTLDLMQGNFSARLVGQIGDRF